MQAPTAFKNYILYIRNRNGHMIPCGWVAVIEAICEERKPWKENLERKTVRILKTKSQTVINCFSEATV